MRGRLVDTNIPHTFQLGIFIECLLLMLICVADNVMCLGLNIKQKHVGERLMSREFSLKSKLCHAVPGTFDVPATHLDINREIYF